MDLATAADRAAHVRDLYEQLEERHHGEPWSLAEIVVGLNQDIGDLGRLVMASQGRWQHGDDVSSELGFELAECMWWLFVIARRTGVDLEAAYASAMDDLDARLTASVDGGSPRT